MSVAEQLIYYDETSTNYPNRLIWKHLGLNTPYPSLTSVLILETSYAHIVTRRTHGKLYRLQVSCNDWHVESELSSAYLLEKLLANGREAGVEAEVGVGDADPDTWVETPYALRQPCSLHEETGEPMCKLGLDGTWQRPWADEMRVSAHLLAIHD